MKSFLTDTKLILCLVGITLLCYWQTLGGYFLADDFVHVAWLDYVFKGHPELILQNFYSTWVQTEGTAFYRPLISLTLAVDCLLWGYNAFGYHITNTLYEIACSIFLFLTVRRLLSEYGPQQSRILAFGAAALFASYPLHPEVVSWVIGRVDSVCFAYYLISFWLYLRARQDGCRKSGIASLFAFALSLMSKEMAVTLPAVLLLWEITGIKKGGGAMVAQAITAVRPTLPYWILLSVYLVVRTLALGGSSGGYAGSIGESLNVSVAYRWFGDGSLWRLLFPLNGELFGPGEQTRKILRLIYRVALVSFFVQLIFTIVVHRVRTIPLRGIAFTFGWLVLSLIPTYQVWILLDNLQGSRFSYSASAPLCLLIALFFIPRKPLRRFGILLLGGLVCTYTLVSFKNNSAWAHAHEQVRSLQLALQTQLSARPGNLVLMNLPQHFQGAHMLYNSSMLSVLLNQPLAKSDLRDRVITFEPITFGDSNLLNASRFRNFNVKQPECLYQWNLKEGRLEKVDLDPRSLAIDFVDVDVTAAPSPDKRWLLLSWRHNGQRQTLLRPLKSDGQRHNYRICVSQYKNWMLAKEVTQLKFYTVPDKPGDKVHSFKFSSNHGQVPILTFDDPSVQESPDGTVRWWKNSGRFQYDASAIPGAKKVVLEISRPNSWFEHYTGELKDPQLSDKSMKVVELPLLKGVGVLPARTFPSSAYYEIRLAALSEKGEVIGAVSDPITLHITGQQIAESTRETALR
jgi:hypothetical protein